MAKVSKSKAMRALEAVTGGPLTFGEMIWSIREGEEMSLAQFAKPLGISRQHLNDIEKGERLVSPTRAAGWAQILGYPVAQFVRLALQGQLDADGLDGFRVAVEGKLARPLGVAGKLARPAVVIGKRAQAAHPGRRRISKAG